MFKKINKQSLLIGSILILGMLPVSPVLAADTCRVGGEELTIQTSESGVWKGLEECRVCGNCELNDFVQLGVNIFEYIMGVVGSLALLAFIYGGILFLLSGGNSDRIEKGKKVLTGAAIGLVVIFASYLIISFVAQSVGVTSNILEAGWFSQN